MSEMMVYYISGLIFIAAAIGSIGHDICVGAQPDR